MKIENTCYNKENRNRTDSALELECKTPGLFLYQKQAEDRNGADGMPVMLVRLIKVKAIGRVLSGVVCMDDRVRTDWQVVCKCGMVGRKAVKQI